MNCPFHPNTKSETRKCGQCDFVDYHCPEKNCGYGSGHVHYNGPDMTAIG